MTKAGVSIADIAAGVTAYHSILAALLHRDKIGRGDHIDVSMLRPWPSGWVSLCICLRRARSSEERRRPRTIYPYGPYETVDGIVFRAAERPRNWTLFAEVVLRQPDLAADPRFKGNAARADHRELLEPILLGILSSLSLEEAIARLDTRASPPRMSMTWRLSGLTPNLRRVTAGAKSARLSGRSQP